MGLKAIFQAAAKVAFSVAGDVKTEVTLYTSPTYAHDTTSDTSTPTWGQTVTGIEGLLYDHKDSKKNDGPEVTTKALLLQVSELQGATITQECEVDADSQRWKVREVNADPASATVELILYA